MTRTLIVTTTLLLLCGLSFGHSKDSINPDSLNLLLVDTLAASSDSVSINALGPFVMPFSGKVISPYGKRGRRFHAGTDIKLALGDSVRVAFGGVVSRATRASGYGLLVVVSHGFGVDTYYAHLSKMLVDVGDTLLAGTVVGLGGRTGRATTTHLHFEFRVNGKHLDPERVVNFASQALIVENIPNPVPVASLIKSELTANVKESSDYHVVAKNDTLYSLARRYGTTVKVLCELNGITPNTILKIGRKLKVSEA
ncbi:MAG: peptidoglycan DD-metalloendopeptidase family protein [Bacteroidales bacterium]|nr:peptidoglycan DD-metalloendopeptidase family protein [Bacteroidales bacterium]MBN2749557.1 peptidoglycan DD-metalloendopeptidase family protein [Bacteroidales bacterium]